MSKRKQYAVSHDLPEDFDGSQVDQMVESEVIEQDLDTEVTEVTEPVEEVVEDEIDEGALLDEVIAELSVAETEVGPEVEAPEQPEHEVDSTITNGIANAFKAKVAATGTGKVREKLHLKQGYTKVKVEVRKATKDETQALRDQYVAFDASRVATYKNELLAAETTLVLDTLLVGAEYKITQVRLAEMGDMRIWAVSRRGSNTWQVVGEVR